MDILQEELVAAGSPGYLCIIKFKAVFPAAEIPEIPYGRHCQIHCGFRTIAWTPERNAFPCSRVDGERYGLLVSVMFESEPPRSI